MIKQQQQQRASSSSLFQLKEILDLVNDSTIAGNATIGFTEILRQTRSLHNRTRRSTCLKLLVELGWLVKLQDERPGKRPGHFVGRSHYQLTEKGRSFLSLFPEKRAEFSTQKAYLISPRRDSPEVHLYIKRVENKRQSTPRIRV
jgi:hypothetical protein